MKHIKKLQHLLFTMIFLIMSTLIAVAQDTKSVDININKNSGGNWYTQPWVWIVGAAVFILLLVALLRSNNSRD
jgi:hypothetical protein